MTNAVKHAYKEKNNVGIINIYFEILEDKIKIVISDKGDSLIMKQLNQNRSLR